MKKLERLLYREPGQFLNPLAQIFFAINLIDGIAFTFFSHTAAVQSIGLVTLAPAPIVLLLGIFLLALSLLNVTLLVTRRFAFGTAAAMLGFITWVYVVGLYAAGGLWLALLIHPLPQVAFWSWYFFAIKRFKQ